jgi:hypothetical protein
MIKSNSKNFKKIIFLNARESDRTLYNSSDLIKKLSKKYKIYVLNIFNLKIFEKKINYQKIKKNGLKNINFINIENYQQLEKFLKEKKSIIIINSLTKGLKDFKIYFYLKKYNPFIILIDDIGHLGGKIGYDTHLKFFFKSLPHLFEKGFYYFWRVLTILNIFPKINLLFVSDLNKIKSFKNGISSLFEKKFPKLKISLYRKIIRINSRSYNSYIKKNKSSNGKFILYADSPINHFDRESREGVVTKNTLKNFYENLFYALNKLQKITKLKLVVTLHPNEFNNKFKLNLFKKYKIKLYKSNTSNFISNCGYMVFTHSSAVVNAVMFKKKIICFKSKYLGEHFNRLADAYIKKLNLFTIDVDNTNFILNNKTLKNETKNSIKFYNKYINTSLIYKRNIHSSSIIETEISKISKI